MLRHDLENSTDFCQAVVPISGIFNFQAAMELTRP